VKYLPFFLIAVLLSGCATDEMTGRVAPSAAASTHVAQIVRPSSRALPFAPPAPPLPKAMRVRTTAYCRQEGGNAKNALNYIPTTGTYYSAAADWSRFPAGTMFRVVENGRTYLVDDYGSALVGTDTIDLFVPTMREMNKWGVRHVHIYIIKKGSYERSLAVLKPRAKRGYIQRMVRDLEAKVR
jgi:3D (Asp-Asp-Asp) domain-containing protein